MLINDLVELNKRLSSNLWDIANVNTQPGGLSPRLILPKKRDDTIRISEQEARILYCNLLNQSSYYYTIETPTEQVYKQEGQNPLSARSDLSLYRYNGNEFNKIVNIEFKAHNPKEESFRKDIEKIVREGITGNWFHTIDNIDSGTLPSIFQKLINSFKDCASCLPENKIYLYYSVIASGKNWHV
jgi:hypothetical protein